MFLCCWGRLGIRRIGGVERGDIITQDENSRSMLLVGKVDGMNALHYVKATAYLTHPNQSSSTFSLSLSLKVTYNWRSCLKKKIPG